MGQHTHGVRSSTRQQGEAQLGHHRLELLAVAARPLPQPVEALVEGRVAANDADRGVGIEGLSLEDLGGVIPVEHDQREQTMQSL